ncbi:hypothetical protein KIS4809_4165 [Bacillus sp. ZZV12-4809]|nr:hypothetical protein KIS4809_4165 [Bacillus sp. ZZV12-4809]
MKDFSDLFFTAAEILFHNRLKKDVAACTKYLWPIGMSMIQRV